MLCAIKPRRGDILVFVYCSANEFFINDALNRYITPNACAKASAMAQRGSIHRCLFRPLRALPIYRSYGAKK